MKPLESASLDLIKEIDKYNYPVMLYSAGKNSNVLLHLIYKAFYPNKIPLKLIHIDTGYESKDIYNHRKKVEEDVLIYKSSDYGRVKINGIEDKHCCNKLLNQTVCDAINLQKPDIIINGSDHQNCTFNKMGNELLPLYDWTELDIWNYIKQEEIPVSLLYFATYRSVIEIDGLLMPIEYVNNINSKPMTIKSRYEKLGCLRCTPVILSDASTIDDIINELY